VTDPLAVLRSEFDADDASFVPRLRADLVWDRAAFLRLTDAMLSYARSRSPEHDIPRRIAQGFWYLDWFVPQWSQHPNFPRDHGTSYYEEAHTRLHELAFFLFVGQSPQGDVDSWKAGWTA
jgi:hypothetical protein